MREMNGELKAQLAAYEQELALSEHRFRTVIEKNADGVVVVDEEGRVLFLNPAAERLFGRDKTSLIGEMFGFPVVGGETTELDIFRPDNETTIVEMRVVKTTMMDGAVVYLASLRDITARKQAEDALAWEAAINAAIADLAHALVQPTTIEDISAKILQRAQELTNSAFGHVGYIDPKTGYLVCPTLVRDCEIHHGSKQEVTFKTFDGLWGWVLQYRQPLLTNALQEDPRATDTEIGLSIHRFVSAPALIGDQLVGQVALANAHRDYTPRDLQFVQRLASLYALAVQRMWEQDARERFRTALNCSAESIFLIDRETMAFIDVNDTSCASLGYTYEELLSMGLHDVEPQYTRAALEQVFDEIIQGEVSTGVLETVHQRKDGSEFPVEVYLRAMNTQSGPLLIASARNVTERHQMEARLEEYTLHLERLVVEKVHELEEERAKVIHTAKLAALGEMATGVAHELNQPLTSMLFDADYLKAIAHHGEAAVNVVPNFWDELAAVGENLASDINRCRRIIDHLRTFGRVFESPPVPINLNQPLKDSFILIGERLRQHDVALELQLDESVPMVLADPQRLEQVFLNLITNAEYALEAMAKRVARGAVALPDYHKRLTIATFRDGDSVVARVQDNGCGISPADQERIFEPFFTTKPVGEGTGLGLSITYGIVNEFGGNVTFESAENEGTTFILRFPIFSEQPV